MRNEMRSTAGQSNSRLRRALRAHRGLSAVLALALGLRLIPLVEGVQGFAAGDWQKVITRIEPVRLRIVELGGSRAQRDVFHDTFLEACFRAGDMDRAGLGQRQRRGEVRG